VAGRAEAEGQSGIGGAVRELRRLRETQTSCRPAERMQLGGTCVDTVVAAFDGIAAIDVGRFANIISLIALPFAHEDLAIVLGGYIVVNKLMPVGLVVACIYVGMVVSDFALYGVGAGARRLPWLRQFAVDGN